MFVLGASGARSEVGGGALLGGSHMHTHTHTVSIFQIDFAVIVVARVLVAEMNSSCGSNDVGGECYVC